MPVPSVVKCTLALEAGARGWSESFLWQTTGNDLNLEATTAQVLAQKRAAMLGREAFVKAERVSFESDSDGNPVVGDSFLTYTRYNGASIPTADDPDTAVLITMRSPNATRRRNMFLRGIWDDVNGNGGFYLPGVAGWLTAFNSWRGAMLAKRVGWWHSNAQPAVPITGYTCDQDTGFVLVTLAAAHPSFVANKVEMARIKGVNAGSPMNGAQLIRWQTSTTFWLEKPLALIAYQFGGSLVTYQRTFEEASSIDAQKIVTRRAGSPLLESVGRRKARRRA